MSERLVRCRSLLLAILMITMAQVGYTMNGFDISEDLTLDSMNEPAEVPTNNDIQNLYVGGAHSCVITEGELMKCWGNNSAGQLGIGNSESMGDEPNEMGIHLPYLDLGTGLVPESAALGMSHTCILFTNNSLKCFGDIEALGLGYTDANGAGDGYLETGDYLPFWPAPTGRNVSLIAAGWYHTCAVLDDGSMTCWGENNHGQLGMGNTTDLGLQSDQTGDSISYVSLPTGVTISDMALGEDHTCVLYDTGDVACWGGNDFGQLGIGSTEDIRDEAAESLTNISFPTGRYAIDITAGDGFTCALLDTNEAICWGLNDVGQLGQGNSNNYGDSGSEPVSGLSTIDIHSSASVRTIDAGYDHVCVSLNNNAVKCWGGNLFGHLGIGISGPNAHRGDDVAEMGSNLPSITLGSGMNPKTVQVGENFACMLKQSNTMPVKCWGSSVHGRLGYENTETLGDSSTDNLANNVNFALDSEYASVDCGDSPFNTETHILPSFEIDSNQKGRTLDIAFRSDGCPGIVYSDDNTDNLRFAMYDNGIWVFEYPYTSNIGNSSALDVSLVFDENDVPHIAWSDFGYDSSNYDTHYATKANGKWNHVQLENSMPVTVDTEIIHFGDGDLEIIASPFTMGYLFSELCSASTDCLESSDWNSQTVIASFAYMQGLDSDIGLNGDAWVSQSITSGSTDSFNIVSKPTGGSWNGIYPSLTAPNSTGSTSAISDIEVAPDGTVHAVYLHEDYATDGIMYVSCSGGRSNCSSSSNWSFIPVPYVTNKTFSLAVDYDLVPHVFFNSSSSLQYTKLVDGSWTTPVEILNLAVNEVRADFHPNGKLWLGAQLTANDNIWMIEGASFGGNGMSIDIDGDGWSGIEEYRCGSDMINSSSTPADADFDGICDAEDEIHDLFTYGESRTTSVGEDFSCGLTAQPDDGSNSNTLYCWGSNSHQQLGNFVVSNNPVLQSTAWAVPVLDLPSSWHAVDVDVGARHACAIGVDGDVYCWGDNAHGQLGINSTVATSLPVEVQLPVNTRAMSISAGSQHTCVVTTVGELYCWGDSSNQQLGEYYLSNSSGYIEETFSSSNWLDTTSFSDVYIGQYGSNSHDNDWTYSTDNGGTLKWDLSSSNTRYNEFSFTIQARSDGYITFDVKSDMGSNDYVGLFIDSSNQVWYHPPNTWTTRNHSFTAGTHELAFIGINQAHSSGFNDAWLDNIVIHAGFSLEEGGIVRTPAQVSLGSMIVSEVTTGDDHTCIATSTGAAYCWGDNGDSTTMTLGNSSFTGTNSSSPLSVDLAGTGSQYSGSQPPIFGLLSAGAGATCGTLLTNASTICWGKSSAGTSILGGGSGPSIHGTFVSLNDTAALNGIAQQLGSDIDGEAANDASGRSVSMNSAGDRIAIGASGNDGSASNAGHVRIYEYASGSWSQLGSDIDGEAASDNSGHSVSMNSAGDRVAIGAYNNDGTASNAGHVRIYEYASGSWSQLGSDIDGEAENDISGVSVSMNSAGDRVAIGAYNNDGTASNAGHVRIYEYASGSWSQLGSDIDGEATIDYSGASVSMNSAGDRVAIGAYNNGHGTATSGAGHVRIYEYASGSWSQLGADIDGEAASDASGYSVSMNSTGDRVAIGAWGNDGTASNAGHVRIYEYASGSWSQLGADIDGEAASDGSGYSVSMNSAGDRVAIGAYNNDGTASNAGHVRIYEYASGSWSQLGVDIDGEAANDASGASVSMNSAGDRVAIGAYGNAESGTNAGHARVYYLTPSPPIMTITASSLSVGHHHACAVVDEKIQCWGEENGGELGDGGSSSSSSSIPVEVDITGLGIPIDVSVSEIGNTSCALFKKDLAYSFRCWGSDEVGALGDDASYNNETSPSSNVTTLTHGFVEPTAPSSSLDIANYDIAEVSGGQNYYCARSYQGLVKCWGYGPSGRLGIGSSAYIGDHPNEMGDYQEFTDLGTNLFATDITTGLDFACAVLNNTQIKCWGEGGLNQLGNGNTNDLGDGATEMGDNLPYVRAPGTSLPLSGIVKVDAGYRAACALSSEGQVFCWGYNDNYLVNPTVTSGTTASGLQTQLSRPAIDIAVGDYHACVILDNHQVQCWGRNSEGQLGTGNKTNPSQNIAQKERPYVDLGSDVGALDIMAGGTYTCAILTTEGTVCWGNGGSYRHGRNSTNAFSSMGDGLGNGTGSPYDTIAKPTRSSLSPFSQGTCIVDEWSEVQCWGHNYIAGTTTAAPITINVGGHVRSVAVSDGPGACAIRIDGSLVCWGSGSYGQMGQGDSANNPPSAAGEISIEHTDVRLWSPDTDFDGMLNLWDDDDDDDGVLDINDAFSLDECASVDTDNDGMPDTITSACSTVLVLDLDDDNDGWTDVNEILCDTNSISSLSVPIDTDSDGTCNYLDMDDDNDGWTDSQEHECEPQSFTSFRAVGSNSGAYPNTLNNELYFGGPNSDELRYLGRSSQGFGGLWMWPSATKDSVGPSSSSQRFSTSNYGDITLEHQDGVTYYADRQYQGQFNDEINGLSSHSSIQTYYSSSTSYRSEISLDADNRVYISDGYYRFWHQNTIDSSTYTYTNLPNTNSNNKHHLEAQDNGTVHHLWWHSNDLKYTQSHPVTGSSGRSYDSIETIGGWANLNNHQFDLEVDSNGVAHIAFYRSSSSSYAITYMNNSAGSFSTIGFENSLPQSAGHVDLDIDPLGRVNLAWTDPSNNSVYHTIIDGTTTSTQPVPSTHTQINSISQALDPLKNQSYIFTSSGATSTVSYQGSFKAWSIDSTSVPGDIDSDGICDNLETAPVIYPPTSLEIGSSASISPSFPGLSPTLIINTTPLPAGLTLDQSTGVITGTPINSNLAFSVTLNSTSAQENWTGTIVIKIVPMAPLLTNYNSFLPCSVSNPHQNIEFASDGSMFYSFTWTSACSNSLPTDLPGLENKSTFDTSDLIIAKRSVDGVWQWAHVIQSSGYMVSSDIALNSNDEPLLLFGVNSNYNIEFDRSHGHNIIASSLASGSNLILVQFNETGHVVWNEFSRHLGPYSAYNTFVRSNGASESSIVVSPNGNITIMGEYYSSSNIGVSFGFGTLNVSRNVCSTHWQPFIVRLDSSGVVQWMNTGNSGQRLGSCGFQYSLDLAASSDGGVFLATNQLTSSSGFGNLTAKYIGGYTTLSIFSFDSSGQAEWYQMVSADNTHLQGISIAVFDDDSVHVTATPNFNSASHGTIHQFFETGVSTTSSGYNAGWNNTVSPDSTHQWTVSADSRAWLMTARLNGNNGTPIWVDMNTDKISSFDDEGYGSRSSNTNSPSPVSYIQNNVAHVYVTDPSSSGLSDAAAFYRSSSIDNDEIHHVISSTSNSYSTFGIMDFGPDGNDLPFFLQISYYSFYWGYLGSVPEFSNQPISSSSYVLLNRMIGIAGHRINEKMPEVGVYFDEYPVDYSSYSSQFASWSLIGTNGSNWLPSGLNFVSSSGRIYGTPTTITANATYWLNHTTQGRTISSLITFGVSPTAPTLSYSGSRTLERGDTMTSWTPSITGISYLQSITVTPSLPNGITIDQSNGTIEGTPMYNMSSTQYSIVACNSWGVCGTTETITLVINEPLASPVWGGNNTLAFARDVTVRECPVTSAGGMVATWAISSTPNLPYGLTFNTTTGCFEGTPLLYTNAQNYDVTATNSGGSTPVTVEINITGAGIGLTYPAGSLILENGTAMQPIAGQTTGDNAQSWNITPTLPAGLSFGTTNGTIWGTPSESSVPTNYTVTVTSNSAATGTFTIEIEVLEPVEEITLSLPFNSLSLTNLTEMQPLSVQTTGHPAVSWSISPALPSGLELGPTNGTLWGTPIQANASTVYTITAVTLGGATDNISLTIEVLDIVEEIHLTMPTNLVMLVNGSAMQPISGQTSGDTPVTWTITPALSSGLDFGSTNGTIWGTPNASSILTTYTVTVYTAGGFSDSATLQMIVQEDTDGDSIPDIVDLDDDNDGVLDGNEETGCELDPDCDDDGTNDGEDAFPLDPSEDSDFDNDGIGDNADEDDDNDGWTEANETACGGHSDLDPLDYPSDIDGDGECDFTDTTDDREIAISYSVTVLDLTINQAMSSLSPTVTGGNVTNWSISPTLPNGLTFNETGVLTGTPSTNTSTIQYTVTAINGQYTAIATLTITVYEVTGDADADGISDAMDPDDDNDGWTDLEEAACNNTNSLDANDHPTDLDGDGICDFVDDFRDLPLAVSYPSQILQLANGSLMDSFIPTVAGGDVATWEISGELPEGLTFGWSPARDASMDGSIRGTPTEEIPPTTYLIWANNSVSSATFEVTISVLLDTDTDGTPDIYDLDDDGDTWSDVLEGLCGSDSLDVSDSPSDEDNDGICDALSTGPDVTDTDGDGVPDESDAFPNDSAAAFDNDNDGMPDDIFGFSQSTPRLIEDLDDDNDGWLDTREAECGSDRFDNASMPIDSDEDGSCDGIDQDRDGDGFNNIVDAFPSDKSAFADLDNDGLPDNLTGSSNTGLVADTDDDGDNYTDQEEIECGSDPMDINSIPPDADGNGLCDAKENTSTIVEPEPDEEGLFLISSKYWWCCILFLLLLLFLLIPLMGTNKKIILARKQGPEPPNTDASPKFLEGKGTRKDPFVLASFTVQPGSTQICSEKITITNISSGYLVGMSDRMETENDTRFQMVDVKDKDEFEDHKSVSEIEVGEDGTIVVKFLFTDEDHPTLAGGSYDAIIRLGSASVYFSWNVVVEGDPDYIAEQKAEEEARIAAAVKAQAEEEEEDAEAAKVKAEAEAVKVKAEAEAEATKVKAEAEAEAAKVKAEAEAAKVKAEAEAEIAKVKAEAEVAKAKAEAEAESQKAAAEKAKAEAESAKAKAEAEAESQKAAAEKAKAEAESAKAKAEAERAESEKAAAARIKQMEKEMEARRKRLENLDEKTRKKEEELLRVAEKAKSIDFGTLGVASSTKLKKKVEKNSTELEVGDASKFAESGEAYISDVEGGARISWKSKSGNKLVDVKGIKRGFAAAAIVTVRDDLQTIKGIGPFIEDKLHALGIFTFNQVGNMNSELEETVNVAIEFFSGRVKRDEWAKQARKLAKNR